VLAAGLRGSEGGETPAERRFDFRTSGLPRVVRTDPAEGITTGNRWGIHIQFNNPMDVESLEPRIAITGIDADDMQFFSWEPQSLQVQAPLQPSTDYTLTIAAGATDRDGLPLAPFTLSFRTGEIASFVSFAVPGHLATYSSDAEPILYFHSVNRHSVQFALHPVTEAEARSILAVGHFPDQPNRWWTPSGPPLRRWTETLEIERDRLNLNSTSLGDGEPLPRGHYYVVATGGEHSARLLFSVVDTSIVVKTSLDELLVWALDYATGEPLAGVQVTALGPGISSPASTDASGLASFAIPRPRDMTNQNRTYVVRIEAGGRFGVGTTLWTQGTDPWRAGIPFQWETQPYVGHLYTDRPIYRPGETVHYKAVARADDDAVYTLPHEAPPLVIVVRDPQGQELWRHDVTLNDLGTFAGEILLPSEASIGTYTMQFQYKDERQPWSWITYGAFTVAEFRRPEFEVTT
jgi:alpha-2-macroglobulin